MTDFAYCKAASLADAIVTLSRTDLPVCVLAGGTNVAANIRGGQAPALLLDITALDELQGIHERDGKIRLGALATVKSLASSPLVRAAAPALWQAANCFADPTTRRRATVGGNLCNASPGADTAPPLLVHGATVGIAGPGDERCLPLEEFFTGSFRTVLAPGELVKWIDFTPKTHSAFIKLGHRGAMAISITTVALAFEKQQDGTLENCRIAYGASGPTPLRARRTEALFEGKRPGEESFLAAAQTLREDLQLRDGLRGSLKYRQNVVGTLLRRAMLSAYK